MKNLFSNPRKVIAALVAAAGLILAVISGITGNSIPSLLGQAVAAPFKAVGAAMNGMAQTYYSYMFRYEALAAENEVLEERIAEMEDVAREADSISRENERLIQAQELMDDNPDFVLVDAYIIGWNTANYEYTFIINRGLTSGIQTNMCAVTAEGQVVGLVTYAEDNFAEITTVLDSTLEISGTISSSGYNGMIQGGYVDGNDTLLRMNYLPSSSIIRNNDQVVTAGSAVYPKGLILGSVVDAGFEETGVAKYALLNPAAQINSLEQVFIITSFTSDQTVTTPTEPEQTTPETTASVTETTAPQTTG